MSGSSFVNPRCRCITFTCSSTHIITNRRKSMITKFAVSSVPFESGDISGGRDDGEL